MARWWLRDTCVVHSSCHFGRQPFQGPSTQGLPLFSNSLCSSDTYPQRMKVGPWHRCKFTTHAPDFGAGALDKIKGHDPFIMHSWHTENWGRRTYRWRSAWATSDPQNQNQNRGGEDKQEEEKQGQEQEEDWLGPLLGKRCLTVVEVWHGP